MSTSTRMERAAATVASCTLVILLSCEDGPSGPAAETGLSLSVTYEAGFTSAADAGLIRIEGPTPRTQGIQPGQTVTVEGLQPGNYTVALEGLLAGGLESFGETTVTVVAGQNRQANITLRSFTPSFINVSEQTVVGQPITVQFGSVQGASIYVIEWSTDATFSNAQSTETSSTSLTVTPATPGTYLFRARARNRFGTVSVPSTQAETRVIAAETPPVVAQYTFVMRNASACVPGFRDLLIDEEIVYQDADANFPAPQTTEEPALVDSEFRFEGRTEWSKFYAGKTWSRVTGGPSAGRLRSGACWSMSSYPDATYVEYRVRMRDSANATYGDWVVTRIMLPRTVAITPSTLVDILAGGTIDFGATVRDANGNVLGNDLAAWTSYTGAGMGSVDEEGTYQAVAAAAGLDRVFAWSGAVANWVGIRGPAAGTDGSWWAPCWFQSQLSGQVGTYRYNRMTVFAGQEYSFTLAPTENQTATGDPDLYIRMGAQPTIATFDSSSTSATATENIRWKAESDGVVWIAIHAFTAFTNVTFDVRATDDRCGFPGQEALAASPDRIEAAQTRAPVSLDLPSDPRPAAVSESGVGRVIRPAPPAGSRSGPLPQSRTARRN